MSREDYTYTHTVAESTGHPPQTPDPQPEPAPQPTGGDDE